MIAEKMCFVPQDAYGYLADIAISPFMYLFQGNYNEIPQRTHVWNNDKFVGSRYVDSVSSEYTFYDSGNNEEKPKGLVRFHLPVLGGWKNFLVLSPVLEEVTSWHIGWHNWDEGGVFAGISLIPIRGCVRVLQGDKPMRFFGILPHGIQVPICLKGFGTIGQAGAYATLPLL